MSRFGKFYLTVLAITLVFAVLAKFFSRYVDARDPGLPGLLAVKILGGENEMQPLSEDLRLEETFDQIEIAWPLGDVHITPLPDGETSARVRYNGRIPKAADQKDLFGYRVADKTLKIKSGENKWSFGFEIGEGRFAVAKPEVNLHLELPKNWKGSINIKTVGGDIDVGFFGLDSLKIKTVGGDFRSDWRLNAKSIELKSVNGDAKIFGAFGDIRAESVSGDLHLGLTPNVNYAVEAKSVSGGVENNMKSSPGKSSPVPVKLKTVSGDIIIAPMEKNPEDSI